MSFYGEKGLLRSKTIQGILVAVLPRLLELVGVELSESEAGEIVAGVVTLAGAAWGIYGRIKAQTRIVGMK